MPEEPRVELVTEWLKILRDGGDAERVDAFLARYAGEMTAGEWRALLNQLEGVLTAPSEAVGPFGFLVEPAEWVQEKLGGPTYVDQEDIKARVQNAAFKAGVLLLDRPTTWTGLGSAFGEWVRTEEGRRALGIGPSEDIDSLIEEQQQVDVLLEQGVAQGLNAAQLAEIADLKSPLGLLVERLADPAGLLEENAHLAGQAEIPAGTPIFFQPRSAFLGPEQTVAGMAAEWGLPVEAVVGFNQRIYQQLGQSFDPDRLVPGQQIYKPPASYIAEVSGPVGVSPEQRVIEQPGLRLGRPTAPLAGEQTQPEPFLPGPYAEDYLPGFEEAGFASDVLDQMAANDPAGLVALLMEAQYGDTQMGGWLGGYLRRNAPDTGMLLYLFNQLGIGGGAAGRGGDYRTFEDIYESLGAGPGTERPEDMSIGDWRNLLYGGMGAMVPGGILSGGAEFLPEPETLSEAGQYLENYVMPLLVSTAGAATWDRLKQILPSLWIEYNMDPLAREQPWAQWLVSQGQLPSRAY